MLGLFKQKPADRIKKMQKQLQQMIQLVDSYDDVIDKLIDEDPKAIKKNPNWNRLIDVWDRYHDHFSGTEKELAQYFEDEGQDDLDRFLGQLLRVWWDYAICEIYKRTEKNLTKLGSIERKNFLTIKGWDALVDFEMGKADNEMLRKFLEDLDPVSLEEDP
jgi:hypothetical protein